MLPAAQWVPLKVRVTAVSLSVESGLCPAKVPRGPIRSTETFASTLHLAPCSRIAPLTQALNTRVSKKMVNQRVGEDKKKKRTNLPCSRVDAVEGSGEGDGFADVFQAADPGYAALYAHAES